MGNIVNGMVQNTPEWHAWRNKGLGASGAGIITGNSSYNTPYGYWEELLGLREPMGETMITALGHKFEPVALAKFCLLEDIDMESDVCMEHQEFPFLRASLDGHSPTLRSFAEVKMVGKENMKWLKENKKPLPHHVDQVGQQFLVTGYERAWYVAYTLDEKKTELVDFVAFPVQPDREHLISLFKQLKEFWNLVQTQTPPPLSDKDVYEFKGPEIEGLVKDYVSLKAEHERLSEQLSEMQEKLKAIGSLHAKCKLGPITVTKVVRKGSVDYKKIPELRNMDLEKYRGSPVQMVRIQVKDE